MSGQLRDLVALCLQRFEAEGSTGIDGVLRDHPDHAEALRRRIDYLRRVGLLEGTTAHATPLPEALGDFRLIRKLGEGGMGVVYLAEQQSLKRSVALKLVRPEQLLFDGARERFRREVDAIARLQHPAIVPIYAVGEEGGFPYFAMERIVGCSLGDVLRHLGSSSPRELDGRAMARAIAACTTSAPGSDGEGGASSYVFEGSWSDACFHLIRQIADAIDHAHRHGVLHRDLKPSNVMVTPSGRALLLDFGLATAAGTSKLTRTGALLGSLPYLAPEQLTGHGRDVDARTDLYGLGVTLFELLALRVPFASESPDETIRLIEAGPTASVRERNPAVSQDAETVCLKAMERDPARRYATPADFARDLDNVLQRRPIDARRAGPWRIARQWMRRRPAASVALLLGALLVVGGPFAFGLIERANTRKLAAAFERAEGLRLSAQSSAYLVSDPGLALLVAIEGARRQPGLVANNALLAALAACREERTLLGHGALVTDVQFSPDGRLVATASNDGTVRLWHSGGGEPAGVLRGHEMRVNSVAFHPDGRTVLTASSDGTLRIWDVESATAAQELRGHEGAVLGAEFSADGSRALSWSDDRTARVWDVARSAVLTTFSGHANGVRAACFSPDERKVATRSADPAIRVFDAATGTQAVELRIESRNDRSGEGEMDGPSTVLCMRFSPDGKRIAIGGEDWAARLFDVESGREVAAPLQHSWHVGTVDWSPDGSRVLTSSWDHFAHVWDAQSGAKLLTLPGHTKILRVARFSPDGRQIVTGGDDHTLRLWDAASGRELAALAGHQGSATCVHFSPDGRRLVSGSTEARLWRTATERQLRPWLGHSDRVSEVALSRDGRRLASASRDRTARIWDAETGRLEATLTGHEGWVISISFSRDGRRVVTGGFDRTARVWDVALGTELAVLRGHESGVYGAEFDATGRLVVTSSRDKSARIWDWEQGRAIATLAGHENWVQSSEFSPDGKQVVTASRDGTARVFDVASATCVATFDLEGERCRRARFSPNGRELVTESYDHLARIWDLATGRIVATLSGHEDAVVRAAFTRDGARLVTASWDGTARLWDVKTGVELQAMTGHSELVSFADFSEDETSILTASIDGDVRRWPVDPLAAALAARPRELAPKEMEELGLAREED